jgi:type II secretory pathway pseudopilin PulG
MIPRKSISGAKIMSIDKNLITYSPCCKEEDLSKEQPYFGGDTMRAASAHRQRGMAMLEVMIASIIILISISGAFVLYQMSNTTAEISTAREELGAIRGNVSRLFSQQPTYSGLDNVVAAKAGLVPSNMIVDVDAGTIVNAFGGDVTIEADDGSGAGGSSRGTDSHYMITSAQVPREACIQLSNYNRTDWEEGVSVNGAFVDQDDIAAATTNCSEEDDNELIFVGR